MVSRPCLAESRTAEMATEANGKWNEDATRQAAEAIARHGPFDGIISQAGDAGVVQR